MKPTIDEVDASEGAAVTAPVIAVAPKRDRQIEAAVIAGGASLGAPRDADGLVWTSWAADGMRALLEQNQRLRWIQLPSAGVEEFLGLLSTDRTWTSAKPAYAGEVAEHALALALAVLHRLESYARMTSWTELPGMQSLRQARVTILGAGHIASALVELLRPFECRITLVRRRPQPMAGISVLGTDRLVESLEGAKLVVIAVPLTEETRALVGSREFDAMSKHTVLVNVGRGAVVVTEDLVRALENRQIAGAGLDVTDPEPLPRGHPLWHLPNCLVTPHTANPNGVESPAFRQLVERNVRHFVAGEPLEAPVDPELAY